MVLVISPAGFLEDLLGCSAICIICDSNHTVSMLKCMCNQNKVHSFIHVARVEETGGIIPIFMASRTDNRFKFYHFVPIVSTFYNNQLDIAFYKTHTHIFVLNI